ncbi:precorrin-2 dehydrogenase/sirohydrochlorin ferrochelatase family protein [Paramaledivibacter caminithermalis]|jgi:precorrin-2 dehydrogenase/sirohydrochlorin ferrochelatase|uniref:precorrin-2 dehydrogenase n=1 Tax=Paramaledivibacter caminithermalis (strain DSM 15212 / CIP 107654 / DViRD3) TaxID=1121301 RepID=A0A1M6MKW7_PARC5|nr:bifunctional precorrin-2 dehydrogenase/sirohydrochlorin ferrochelatase [Paramaledivibacter caminithermalis]SHJ84145.1 precorrin-2 dehydrogenase / sirohydrochlorin ferrochelatase [Paramaledivibacter caminithermalis DSM 15212]
MDRYYPIMLDIRGKKCKIIGGGKVAERKATTLLEYGAVIEVISPVVTDKFLRYYQEGKISWIQRNYIYGDLESSYLVYAATNDEEANKDCLKECMEKNILLNVVDGSETGNFIVPANINRGHLNLSISTNGKSPMLSRKIKEELEKLFPEEYGEYLDILGELREILKNEVNDIEKRRRIFYDLVYSDTFDRYLSGEIEDLKEALYNIYFNSSRLQGVDMNGQKRNNNREQGE